MTEQKTLKTMRDVLSGFKEELFATAYKQIYYLTISKFEIYLLIFCHILQNVFFYSYLQIKAASNSTNTYFMIIVKIFSYFEPLQIFEIIKIAAPIIIALQFIYLFCNCIIYGILKKNIFSTTIQNNLLHMIGKANIITLYFQFFLGVEFFIAGILTDGNTALQTTCVFGLVIIIINQIVMVYFFFNESFETNCFHAILCSKFHLWNMLAYKLVLALFHIIMALSDSSIVVAVFIFFIATLLRLLYILIYPNYLHHDISILYFMGTCFETHFLLALIFQYYLPDGFASLYFFSFLPFVHKLSMNLVLLTEDFFFGSHKILHSFYFFELKKYILLINHFKIYDTSYDLSKETSYYGKINFEKLHLNGYLSDHVKNCIDIECICPHIKNLREISQTTVFYDGATKESLNGKKIYEILKSNGNAYLHHVYMKAILSSSIEHFQTVESRVKALTHFNTYFLKNYYKGILCSLQYQRDNKTSFDISYQFAIYSIINRGSKYFESMNKNDTGDPLVSSIDIKKLHWLEKNYKELQRRLKDHLFDLNQLLDIQINSSMIYNDEILNLLRKLTSQRSWIKSRMNTDLGKNPMSVKLYIPYLYHLFHNYKEAKKLMRLCTFLKEKKENYHKRDVLFYDAELLYDEKAILIVIGAMKEDIGKILSFNKGAASVFGYHKDEVILMNIKNLMPLTYAIHHDDFLKNYMKIGKENILFRERMVVAKKKNGESFLCSILVKPNLIVDINKFEFMGYLKPVTGKNNFFFTDEHGVITGLSNGILNILNIKDALKFNQLEINLAMLIPKLSHIWKDSRKQNNFKVSLSRAQSVVNFETSKELNVKMYCLSNLEEYAELQKNNMNSHRDPSKHKYMFLKPDNCQIYKLICIYDKIVFNNNTVTAYLCKILKAVYYKKRLRKRDIGRQNKGTLEISELIVKQDGEVELKKDDSNILFVPATQKKNQIGSIIIGSDYDPRSRSNIFSQNVILSDDDINLSIEIDLNDNKIEQSIAKSQNNSISSAASVHSNKNNKYKSFLSKKSKNTKYYEIILALIILIIFLLLLMIGLSSYYIEKNTYLYTHISSNSIPIQYFTSLQSLYAANIFMSNFYSSDLYISDLIASSYIINQSYLNFTDTNNQFYLSMDNYALSLKNGIINTLYLTHSVNFKEDYNLTFAQIAALLQMGTSEMINSNLTTKFSSPNVFQTDFLNFFANIIEDFHNPLFSFVTQLNFSNSYIIYIFLSLSVAIQVIFLIFIQYSLHKMKYNLNYLIEILFTLNDEECLKFQQRCKNFANQFTKRLNSQHTIVSLKSVSIKENSKINKNKGRVKKYYFPSNVNFIKQYLVGLIFILITIIMFVPFITYAESTKSQRGYILEIEKNMLEIQYQLSKILFGYTVNTHQLVNDDVNASAQTKFYSNLQLVEQEYINFQNFLIDINLKDKIEIIDTFQNYNFCFNFKEHLNVNCTQNGLNPYLYSIINNAKEFSINIQNIGDLTQSDYIDANLDILKNSFIMNSGFRFIYSKVLDNFERESSGFVVFMLVNLIFAFFLIGGIILPTGWVYFLKYVQNETQLIKQSLKIYPTSILSHHKGLKVYIERTLK